MSTTLKDQCDQPGVDRGVPDALDQAIVNLPAETIDQTARPVSVDHARHRKGTRIASLQNGKGGRRPTNTMRRMFVHPRSTLLPHLGLVLHGLVANRIVAKEMVDITRSMNPISRRRDTARLVDCSLTMLRYACSSKDGSIAIFSGDASSYVIGKGESYQLNFVLARRYFLMCKHTANVQTFKSIFAQRKVTRRAALDGSRNRHRRGDVHIR